jgi:hypothetical protein
MATKKNRTSFRRATTRRTFRRTTRKSANGGRQWSRTEIAFLRKNYRKNPTSWCARQLGRTAYAVRYKASDLSIKKANPSVWRASGKPTTKKRYASKPSWSRPNWRKPARRTSSRRTSRSRR